MENDTIESFMTLPLPQALLRLEFVPTGADGGGPSKWINKHSGAALYLPILRHPPFHWSLKARLSRGQLSPQEMLNGSINISESTSWVRVTGTESTIDGFSCFGQSPI
jgi:hypothetical protein